MPPSEKYFDNQKNDENTRTFPGTINWSNSTFHGDAKWNYTMIFSADFKKIESGTVACYDIEGNLTNNHGFGVGQVLNYELVE